MAQLYLENIILESQIFAKVKKQSIFQEGLSILKILHVSLLESGKTWWYCSFFSYFIWQMHPTELGHLQEMLKGEREGGRSLQVFRDSTTLHPPRSSVPGIFWKRGNSNCILLRWVWPYPSKYKKRFSQVRCQRGTCWWESISAFLSAAVMVIPWPNTHSYVVNC